MNAEAHSNSDSRPVQIRVKLLWLQRPCSPSVGPLLLIRVKLLSRVELTCPLRKMPNGSLNGKLESDFTWASVGHELRKGFAGHGLGDISFCIS
jgi:hypothetical protein